MECVEPKVYCIAETNINYEQLLLWLTHNKWNECLYGINGTDAEKLIELSGRRCYKSFKVGGENSNPNITKIRNDSKEYLGNILKSQHGSVLEHSTSTWAIENVSRIMTHELVRHKVGTAFCLDGDTEIYSENMCHGQRQGPSRRTIKSIYEKTFTSHGRSRIGVFKLRCLNESSLEFTTEKIKKVINSGLRECFKVDLFDGKSIICSKDHVFLTRYGWKTLDKIMGGISITPGLVVTYTNNNEEIAVNGEESYLNKEWFEKQYYSKTLKELIDICGLTTYKTRFLIKKYGFRKRTLWKESSAKNHDYKNYEWLKLKYHKENLNIKEMAEECGTTESVIRNWLRKHKLQRTKYFKKGGRPWNKGLHYNQKVPWTDEKREFFSKIKKGSLNPQWKGGITKNAQKIRKQMKELRPVVLKRDNYCCRLCGFNNSLQVHHIIPLWTNPREYDTLNCLSNLITLCRKCHVKINLDELKFVEELQHMINSDLRIVGTTKKPRGIQRFSPKFVKIKSVEYAGIRNTYDIETRGPHHNFIANGIITHNSQESGRYCRIEEIKYYMPPEIEQSEYAKKIFEETIKYLEYQQKDLENIFNIDNIDDFNTKKILTSAFRRIAPEGITTGIIITFNMRALRWVIENRTTIHAEREIRLVFNKIANIAVQKWPLIFQDFEKVDSKDGLFEWAPKYSKV